MEDYRKIVESGALKFTIPAATLYLALAASVTWAGMKEPYKASELPLGLEASEYKIPKDNPMTKDKIELGRALYFDVRLSANNRISCATCHAPEIGFTDGQPVSQGINRQQGGRSAPTVINRAFSAVQFWDGRAGSLEEQAKGPLTNPIEMGMPSNYAVVEKLKSIKGYRKWFEKVFKKEVNIDDFAKAVAAFERTVLSGNSPYDRYIAGDKNAMTASQVRGLKLFEGKARCATCHSGFNFTDEDYHNLGVGWDSGSADLGRYMVTKDSDDMGAFKTPTLRDVSNTAPYMHDGSDATLEQVVEFYNKGGIKNPSLDPLMEPLNLSAAEVKNLAAFMKALDGEGWRNISPPERFPE
ncbi:MAG: cytochrome-c peroxidase [bacterium]|nr:MAG: cytochrome-c peroxidase [bacterium]